MITTTTPFIEYPDFLDREINHRLFEHTVQLATNFADATVLSKKLLNWRSAKTLYNWNFDLNGAGPASSLRSHLIQKVKDKYPEVCAHLHIEPFEVGDYEIQLTAHNDGDHYNVHTDSANPVNYSRIITLVYYFHSIPRRFQGGELGIITDDREALIEPDNNKIVFFPSSVTHRVNLISCPDKEFEHSRFTLNGWIRKKMPVTG